MNIYWTFIEGFCHIWWTENMGLNLSGNKKNLFKLQYHLGQQKTVSSFKNTLFNKIQYFDKWLDISGLDIV